MTGTSISGAAQRATRLDYGPDASRTHDLFAWSATGTGAAGAITITFAATNAPESIQVQMYQVVGTTDPVPDIAVGNGATASASTAAYAATPGANTGEVWATAGANGSTAVKTVAPAAGWTEGFDQWNDSSTSNSRAFGLESAARVPAASTSGTFTWSTAVTWGAIRLQFHC